MSRRKPTPKVKEQVARRAEYRCEYCQALRSYSPSPFDTEHIQPYSLGGLSILENLGLQVEVKGNGKVKKQSVLMGTDIKKVDKIILELS